MGKLFSFFNISDFVDYENINTLRILNSVGAKLFVVYGFMFAISRQILIKNNSILEINIYYLTCHFRTK